ncbi:MAG: hypothetical protein B6D39_05305 [Anaerolineae bacterium UTCFX2]|jgi:glycosyltransferase involved in cell wall biosynthesis|nr:glycosyltransferase family 4 protein [Anaerolineales bacterium]OQY92095.1 MAG: hypothetical protein B6D39_05305 [Anaerolineae bacterium UTCFX2]
MHIAILHYAAPPVVGGVESVIRHHARLMTSAGHQVRILAGRGEAVIPKVEFVHVPLFDSRHSEILQIKAELDRGHLPVSFDHMVEKIETLLRSHLHGIDLLIAHNVASLNKNLPLTVALMNFANAEARPPVVLWHHDLAWTTPRYQSELYNRYPWTALSTAWPGVRSQIVVSEQRRQELAKLMDIPPEKILVIPNGIDIPEFLKLPPKTCAILEKLNLLEAAPLLLMPVRLTRRKNIELALQSIACLRKRMPAAQLLITGPIGPHNPANLRYFSELLELRNSLELFRADRQPAVHFLAELSQEFLPDEVIADFYHLADGLLLTSLEEGFGIPVLEAGLSGLPIFCTDIPALRELARDDADYFSPGDSPETIALMIHQRLKYNQVYSLRKRVRQFYDWEVIYRQQIEPMCLQAVQPR